MEPLIKVQCLKHVYPDKTEVNLCGLDFVVQKGERVVVLGPNGSGKTTLISHILGLLKPIEGTVEVMGLDPEKNFNKIRKEIGVVFQNVDEQIIGPRVYDDIAFTPRNDGMKKDKVDEIVKNAASMLNIEHLLNKIPHYLSGGQKKKVALAGALATKPKILIMDEPFDSLDPKSKKEMVALLNELNEKENITLILTTHDIDIVPQLADTIYVIDHGNVLTKGTPEEVFSNAEILMNANLEPPILAELFSRLRSNGFNTSIPMNIDEAERILMRLLERRQIG